VLARACLRDELHGALKVPKHQLRRQP
jgi:hypothetical protein